MKVFISYPPFRDKGSPMWTQNRQFQWYHVGSYIYPLVPAMAATLLDREGFEVGWDDAIAIGESFDQFMNRVHSEKPDLIVFETKTPIIKRLWRLAADLKGQGIESKLVLFGDHVTAKPEESLVQSPVDYVITGGNYDISLLALAKHLRDGDDLPPGIWYRKGDQVRNTGKFRLDFDLNKLPFVDRRLTKAHLYGEKWKKRLPFMYTMVGRDCPWAKCTFCSWTTLYPRFRTRSPDSLLDEIGYLIDEFGTKEIFDDTGTFPGGNWLRTFCKGMIERGYHKEILFSCNMRFDYMLDPAMPELMKEAGFRKVKSGLESASDETLARIRKGYGVKQIIRGCQNAARAGIDVHLTVIVGYPWETREDAQRTLELARKLMADGDAEMLQATTLVPYPGTPLYKYGIENSLFRFDPTDYDRFDMTEPVLKTPDMTPEEVTHMCQGVYRLFLTPKFILRHVKNTRSLEDVSYLLGGAKAVIGHLKDFGKDRKKDVFR
ncbi:MAG: B12-binding domain-containing radical SAM protein [Desulfobacteraceae bacterium]|nr:B12-binding domain-containing radical SAM protein [Desulfobacteraceae bacterium]